jgi:hypothetical protein
MRLILLIGKGRRAVNDECIGTLRLKARRAWDSIAPPRRNFDSMSAEKAITERILNVLRPFASNWSGTLSRGDLVIPQGEIPRLVHQILESVQEIAERGGQATDLEVFQALMAAKSSASVQDQVTELQKRFLILKR